jgi:NADPH-dependent 2,4-dienoyl-CoA reductase/sulfur reductase-like enzyme/rhodanese-related sulfurtransferase
MTMSKTVVIVGGVAGGMSTATRLRRLDPSAEIIVLERSTYVSYANCGLPYHLGGVITDREALILQTPEGLHARFDLDVRVGTEATRIDPVAKTVEARDLRTGASTSIHYDVLVLSPGASTIVPPIPGVELAMPLRTVEDMDALIERVDAQPAHVTVIGGGFIGVEVAENLRHRDIAVTLVEAASQVLAPIDPEMVKTVEDVMRRNGIDLRINSQAAAIEPGAVVLANGDRIETELVVLAIGVRPDVSLAREAGLEIGPRGGIHTDAFHRTSQPDIYAIGDAAEKVDALDGSAALVPLANIANRQGRVVADHIAGLTPRAVPAQVTAIVKVFNLAVASTGWNEKRLIAAGRPYTAIHTHPGSHAGYYPGQELMMLKLLVDPTTQQILGAQAVGGDGVDKRIDVIATAMRGGITAPELMDLELAYAPPFSSAKDPVNMLGYIADNLATGRTRTVQWSEVAEMQAAGATVIDVRTKYEFSRGSIPGALHMPIDDLRELASAIPDGKVIVYCAVGSRGHTATMFLRGLGIDAYNLDGGIKTWSNSPAKA